ncbi:MAG: T9SS type A sorting domain-containing protein [Ignavibacteriales bacterium]|nr:T9SS type A sorting domain-containing protein [Ignavibacteriales bacterium]
MIRYIFIFSLFVAQLHGQTYKAVLYNGTGAGSQEKLLAMTLAGIVNRDSARLYLLNVYETWSYNQTDEKWRDIYRSYGNVQFDSVQIVSQLIDKFREYIQGGISYDPNRYYSNFSGQNFRWQAEQAAMIGGLCNRLPVTSAMATLYNLPLSDSVLITDSFNDDSPVWVTGKVDNPTHPWNNTSLNEEARYLTLLNWGVQNILPLCNPSKFYIREITDWTVSQKMFQVNLAGTDGLDLNSMSVSKADILENVLTYLNTKNSDRIFHIYGWIQPEPMTQWFAFFGSSFHETLLGNLSFHSSFQVEQQYFIPKSKVDPDTVEPDNKYYIIFIGSEGDAANWVVGFQSGAWFSADRGKVPVGWGWNLHLFDECPFLAKYYYDTGTQNDGFLSVTSPLGYAYPDLWSGAVLQNAIDTTKYLMNRFGVDNIYGYKHYAGAGMMTYRGKTISNSFNFQKYGQFQKAIDAKLTMLFDPQLPTQIPITGYQALMFNHTGDGSFYGTATNLTEMANRIITNIKKQTKPGFLIAGYQRFRQDNASISSADITMPRLIQVVNLIKADPIVGMDVEVVTPEMFSVLMRKKLGLLNTREDENIPVGFALHQNYPNPFNPETVIRYQLPVSSKVTLGIYDILGKEVTKLVDKEQEAGRYQVTFDASKLASGVYICRIIAGDFVKTIKMSLVK